MSADGLRYVSMDDLTQLLDWRNAPKNREVMFHSERIQLSDHSAWLEKKLADPNSDLLIYQVGRAPLGFLQVSYSNHVAEWGFYTVPDAPKGTGTNMCTCLIDHIFLNANIVKIKAQVLSHNEASLRLHQKLGFEKEGVLRNEHQVRGKLLDVYCFGLFRK